MSGESKAVEGAERRRARPRRDARLAPQLRGLRGGGAMSEVFKAEATIDVDSSSVEEATERVEDLGEALNSFGVPRVTFRSLKGCTINVNVYPTMTMQTGCCGVMEDA